MSNPLLTNSSVTDHESDAESSASEALAADDEEVEQIAGVTVSVTHGTPLTRLTHTFDEIRTGLSIERPFKLKATVQGIVNLTSPQRLTHVSHPFGTLFQSLGFTSKEICKSARDHVSPVFTPTDILLYPEEALFLVERGSMVLHDHIVAEKLSGAVDRVAKGVLDGKKHLGEDLNVCLGTVGSLSLQECYAVLLGPGRCTLAQYQVYAYLRRAGYVVFRHDPALVSKLTADSTNVGVDGSASNAASVIASPVGLPNLSLPTTLLTKWGSIHRWIVPIFFVLLKSGGRFRWRRAMKSHVTMRKFILYSSRAVWKWLFARVSMICWSVLWHRSKALTTSGFIPNKVVSAPKVKTELVPDFDVYHPNSNFKKSTRSVPDIYLSVFSGDDAVPHGKDLESLFKLARASGPIKRPLIKVAIVEQGRMSFLGLNDTLVDPLDEETKYQGKKRK